VSATSHRGSKYLENPFVFIIEARSAAQILSRMSIYMDSEYLISPGHEFLVTKVEQGTVNDVLGAWLNGESRTFIHLKELD